MEDNIYIQLKYLTINTHVLKLEYIKGYNNQLFSIKTEILKDK